MNTGDSHVVWEQRRPAPGHVRLVATSDVIVLAERAVGAYRPRSRRAFTIIELLVSLGVISILAGMLIPAIQAARESARRAQCCNNLKQLALSMTLYADVHGVFPIGSYMMPSPANPQGKTGSGSHEHSFIIRVLPFFDQSALHASFNADLHYTYPANTTVLDSALPGVLCPSDPATAVPAGSRSLQGLFRMRRTSYRANAGTWSTPGRRQDPSTPDYRLALSQANGVVYYYSRVGWADLIDGASRTMLLGEGALSQLSETDREEWHWWASGNYCDTMFNTLYPPNASIRFSRHSRGNGYDSGTDSPFVAAASSMHAKGTHFAFCDGSVSRIEDSIDTWPADTATGFPIDVNFAPFDKASRKGNLYFNAGRLGVYQALSSRSDGQAF